MEEGTVSHFLGFDDDRGWDACLAQFDERTESNSKLFKVCATSSVTDITELGV
jgi:hypothetical protein